MNYALRADGQGWRLVSGPEELRPGETFHTAEPVIVPPEPTVQQLEEIKRKLLAEAMVKRDVLLVHLERLRTRAIEANNTTARDALSTAITSLENSFNDQRVVNAIDGEVKQVLDAIKHEIGLALVQASPDTYYALLALDAL